MPGQPARELPQLNIGTILRAGVSEWRIGHGLAPRACEGWQLVYVLDGMVEEVTDGRPLRLRRDLRDAGGGPGPAGGAAAGI